MDMHLLYMDKEVKKVFTLKLLIYFLSARNLSNYLVTAKLYLIEKTVGSKNCGSKCCEVCINVNERATFTSTVSREAFIINHKFHDIFRCLVCPLTCKCKIQYVGQTVDQFCSRWSNYVKDFSK